MFSHILTVQFWSLFLMASLKFAFGVPIALGFYQPNFLEGFVFAFAAGVFGIWFWLYISKPLFKAIDYFINRYRGKHPRKKKKIFTPRMRRIAKFKARYGLVGISIVTPILLSIPVGTIIAARFYKHDRRHVFLYLAASVAIWAAIFAGAASILHTTLDIGIAIF